MSSVSKRAAINASRLSGDESDRTRRFGADRRTTGPILQHADELLGEQRVAARPLGDQVVDVGGGVVGRMLSSSVRVSPSVSGGSETMTELRIPPPHCGSSCRSSGLALHRISIGSQSTNRGRAG